MFRHRERHCAKHGHGQHRRHHHHQIRGCRHARRKGFLFPKPFGQRTVISNESRMAANGNVTTWEPNSPDRLLDICSRFILNHPQTYCFNKAFVKQRRREYGQIPESNQASADPSEQLQLLPNLCLPSEICEKLLTTLHDEGFDVSDETAGIFRDPERSRLRSVSVRGSSITDRGLALLLQHKLRDIDIHDCHRLTAASLEVINEHSENLVSLNIGSSIQVMPPLPGCNPYDLDELDNDDLNCTEPEDTTILDRGYVINAPKLERLVIKNYTCAGNLRFLLKPLSRLRYLDLSGMMHIGQSQLATLKHCNHLVSLILHNCEGIEFSVEAITSLKQLRHLDVSQSDDKEGKLFHPDRTLTLLVEGLPNLESLDISGTNLAGMGSFDPAEMARAAAKMKERLGSTEDLHIACDIPGLLSRQQSPLEFLGLYKTHHEACCRPQIPAKRIAGDSSEKQILTAGWQYLDRPLMLENVLDDLFHIFRYESCSDWKSALDVILIAMDRHPGERVIQISGSASLYYIVMNNSKDINIKMKRKILATLLNGMFAHKGDPVLMRNGCLTLLHFQIPQDVICDYERLVKILLHIISQCSVETIDYVQRAGIILLNSLACQVDGKQKLLVGSLGAMEKMLSLIRSKAEMGLCDDAMETAWSFMWNITDETPVNCKRFLDGGGMHLFLQCKEKFPHNQDLLRNMMGLLGNVAEVPELRRYLMTTEFVEEFSFLLDSNSDGIEVSYNAASVLAHLASDGEEAWTFDHPPRKEVLARMVIAINRWNLHSKRSINYRSFEPILRLVRVHHTPECQHWAVWALANLTHVDTKYCNLVEEEGGLTLLEELLNQNSENQPPVSSVMGLAQVVLRNVKAWKDIQSHNLECREAFGTDAAAVLHLDG